MNKYIGQPCTSCRSLIKEGEQVVVCPTCGSPYHKDCYAAEGRCINASLHESGESWQPESPSREFYEAYPEASPDNTESETVGVVCPQCGLTNQPGAVFCSQCGLPLDMQKATQSRGFGGFSPFGNIKREDPELDGVHLSDLGNYVGSNQFYFLPKFLRFAKTKSKFSMNWSAFLFPQLYFLYRKMPIIGFGLLILSTLMAVPNAILVLADSGYLAYELTSNTTLILINSIFDILSYVISFGCGFFANWFYYKKAKKDIEKIKSQTPDDGQSTLLIRKTGGTNIFYVLIGMAVEMAIGAVLTYFLVPMM